ncbi:hypothetical protein RH831_10575 [Halodesulfurarchaeum sp. HSR-GB]|uniref:hypothetical protein n=1 Tax=Halodesulfurarchaeum sp. HSR-GB TaxID=3074077 RepID=UPI00285AD944|nr:hypothetical protein [Halodesulfurarchaeum sp. HSR-GB]MDR5657621.1 hypothetical protein [Halodesulfurarchaeum sp. HSR-GB]
MSSSTAGVQSTLGSIERSHGITPEERKRQVGSESLPARGRIRDEREFIPEGRGAMRGSGFTHTMEGDR